MADVNKSVEITLKANIKQLQDNLEQIPGMTKKEAQAMVRALSAEFNKAQKEAKSAATANKAAAKETAAAYASAGQSIKASFREASQAATESANEISSSFAEVSEEGFSIEEGAETLGTAFGAASLAVDKLIPGLDEGAKKTLELADGLATAAEQAIKGGPVTGALTAATVALTFAVDMALESHRKHAAALEKAAEAKEKAKEKNKELADSYRDLADKTAAIDEKFRNMAERVNEATLDLALARGEMTEAEAESLRIEMEAARMREEGQQIYKDRNQLEKDFRDLKKQEAQALEDESVAIFKAMQDMHQGSQEQIRAQAEYNRLSKEANQLWADLIGGSRKLTEELEGYVKIQENSFAIAKNAAGQYEEQQKQLLQLKLNEEARERSLQRQAEIQQHLNVILSEKDQTEQRIQGKQISRLDGAERINAEAQRELEIIDEKEAALIREAELALDTAKTQKEKKQAQELEIEAVRTIAQLDAERREVEIDRVAKLAELKKQADEEESQRKQKLDQEEQDRFEERIKQQEALTQMTIGSLSSITADGLKLAQESTSKNKDLINVLFRANQAASLANIAMKTAEAVAAAPAEYGPFAPAAIAAIIAQSAVQAGVVLAQKPPLHMGGMVSPLAPDEQSRTLLTGEAVLDRATVRRLGGESGVQKLQQGGTMGPDVIVMNPFKHLDRYNRSAIRNRNSAFNQLQPTQRQKY